MLNHFFCLFPIDVLLFNLIPWPQSAWNEIHRMPLLETFVNSDLDYVGI